MTKREREEAIAKEKAELLNAYSTQEELKAGAKGLTKMVNLLAKKVSKESKVFSELGNEALRDFDYHDKSELKSAVWTMYSVHPYVNTLPTFPAKLELIKERYPVLYAEASKFWDNIKEDVDYVIALTNHVNDEKARFKGTTAQQFLTLASRNNELSREKREAFANYSATLSKWKQAEIKGDKIYVNGKLHNEEDFVGVMIGRGCRVHPMKIYIGDYKDEETGVVEKVIYIRNYTQWRRSGLVILDVLDNIPAELYSERG